MAVLFGAGQRETEEKVAAVPSEMSVLWLTMAVTITLSFLGTLAAYIKFEIMGGGSTLLTSAFMLSYEGNVPTLFSYAMLNFCCLLLLLIAALEWDSRSRWCHHWLILGALFFLLGFDEAASVHEKVIPILQGYGARGMFHFAWVIPAAALLVVLAAFYLRWLLALPGEIRRLMVVSALVYVGGALLVEMPEGAYAEIYGQNTFLFHLFTVVEESFEMMGLSLFSYALLVYVRHLKSHPER